MYSTNHCLLFKKVCVHIVDQSISASGLSLSNSSDDSPKLTAYLFSVVDALSEPFTGYKLRARTEAQAKALTPYQNTIDALDSTLAHAYQSPRTKPKEIDEDASYNSSIPSSTFRLHPRDFLGTAGDDVIDLLPNETGIAIFLGFTAPIILGLATRESFTASQLHLQSMIHGSLHETKFVKRLKNAKSHFVRAFGFKRRRNTTEGEGCGATLCLSGLKHSALNKIQLEGRKFYDEAQFAMLCPALSIEEICDWKPGESYHVVCLVDKDNPANRDYRIKFHHGKPSTTEDVSRAIDSIQLFVKALANHHAERSDLKELIQIANAEDRAFKRLKIGEKLFVAQEYLKTKRKVPVRKLKNSVDFATIATFVARGSIPDPYLLLLKAATNWCKLNDLDILQLALASVTRLNANVYAASWLKQSSLLFRQTSIYPCDCRMSSWCNSSCTIRCAGVLLRKYTIACGVIISSQKEIAMFKGEQFAAILIPLLCG